MDRELIPKSVNILGKTIKIVIKNMDEEHGMFHLDKREIWLDPTQSNEDAVSSLNHEIFHGILQIGGFAFTLKSKQEEALVRLLEHAADDLFYLKDTTKKRK